MKHCFLCVLVLLDRKNPDSFFQPYYRILPKSYNNMPIFWSEDELEWLEGSYILTQIEDRRRNIRADYDEICRAAPEFAEISIRDFSWARMMVASRNFGITIGETKTDALVPYADMLNHLRPRETKWTFSNEQDAFTITSLTDIAAGKQIYDSYGKKCNSRFLLNYGFAIDNNRDADGRCHNEVRILLELCETDPTYRMKLNMLGDDDETDFSVRISMNHDDKNTREALSYARFVLAKEIELMYLPTFNDDTDLSETPIPPISWSNEVDVLELISHLCEEQLKRYPTTLEEDNARLEANILENYSNERNALVLLRGEKEVCHYYINLAKIAIPMLRMQWKDCKKVLAKKYVADNSESRYMHQVVMPLVKKKGAEVASLPPAPIHHTASTSSQIAAPAPSVKH